MITKKHGLRLSKRDVFVGDPLYVLHIESKVSDFKHDIYFSNKYDLCKCVNFQYPYNYNITVFKVSKLKL